MNGKKIEIGTRPTGSVLATAADAWVKRPLDSQKADAMKRLTIDVPESLHRKIKTACAKRGTKIADEVRELLSRNYANEG